MNGHRPLSTGSRRAKRSLIEWVLAGRNRSVVAFDRYHGRKTEPAGFHDQLTGINTTSRKPNGIRNAESNGTHAGEATSCSKRAELRELPPRTHS